MLSKNESNRSNQLKYLSKQAKRKLIKKSTHAEDKFRDYLSKFPDTPFEFQKEIFVKDKEGNVIDFYIADFYVADYNLIIELDGDYHDKDEQIEKDVEREETLTSMGYHILRIDNYLAYNNDALYNKIKSFVKENNLKRKKSI